MENCNSTQAESTLTVNELKEAFFHLKYTKVLVMMTLVFNVVTNCFDPLLKLLTAIFNLSLQKDCFPEELKIARVTTIYKHDDVKEIGNYRPISVLSCFSKILERIMYNRLFKYLTTNDTLIKNNLDFKKDTLLNMQ